MRNKRFVALTAEQGDEIQQRRALGVVSAPLGLCQVIGSAARPGAMQRAANSNLLYEATDQSRMTGHGLAAAHLSLAHSQQIFLITVIDFNLPSIKARLHQQLDGRRERGGQEVSRLAIVAAGVLRKLVRHRTDDYQPQSSLAATALPQEIWHLFLTKRRLPPR